MNSKLLLLAIFVAALSSCTTLYKAGQTPDDVYYSPNRSYGEERKEEQKDEVNNYYNSEDRVIRLGINDYRWRYFDNDYSYNPYNYGFNYGYYYNPYYWPYPVFSTAFTSSVNPKNTTPRTVNLSSYNSGYHNTSTYLKTGSVHGVKSYNNSNQGSAVGNVIRQIFLPGNNSFNNSNSNNNSSSNSNRTYSPLNNSSSGSSSGSRSSGSGGISRPSRGGGN